MRTSPSTLLAFLIAPALLGQSASAQQFQYDFDPSVSGATITSAVSLDLTGDLKGVFDAQANPTGTRTILGAFGDPGTNAEVPITLQLLIDLTLGGSLAGSFELDYDAALGTVEVSGLNATVGAGTTSTAALDVVLSFSTFRTAAPGAFFLGGFPLTLPLGDATIADVTLTQSTLGGGTAAAVGTNGILALTAAVPVDLSFTVDLGALGGGGGPTAVGPIPLLLPIDGQIDLGDCGTGLTSVASEMISSSMAPPTPIDFDDLPFDLPTILPPGDTANLLLSAGLDMITVAGTVDTFLTAFAFDGRSETVCTSEPNSTGVDALLSTDSLASVGGQDLVLTATNLPADSLGYMLMSRTEDNVPGFGGSQGTLCLGSTIYRFSSSVQDSGMLGEVSFSPDFANLPSNQQFVGAETWYFQYWFRDANPTPTSNTTSALRVLFCR